MALIHSEEGRYAEALKTLRKFAGHGDEDSNAETWNNIGNVLERQGNYGEALRALRKSYKMKCKVLGRRHYTSAKVLTSIGNVEEKLGKFPIAMASYQESLDVLTDRCGPDSEPVYDCHARYVHLISISFFRLSQC